MKLLLCKNCQDVIRLIPEAERKCKCGEVSGKYLDSTNAVYSGEYAVPLGFANNTLVNAIHNQPVNGLGKDFKAFVIPVDCSSFKKIS